MISETQNDEQMTALRVERLTKYYPKQRQPALDDVSFQVGQHERLGIIGANGSGKTTLFRLILNLIRPTSGTITIFDKTNPEAAKKYIGFVPEHQQGLENFTVDELLYFSGRMAGLSCKEIHGRKKELLEWVSLTESQNELVSGFSKGMFQRLQLALALLHRPPILLMDEPMSGLDPGGQTELRSLLLKLSDLTLLYASHNLSEIEDICDRVIVLQAGQIVNDVNLRDQQKEIFTIESVAGIQEVAGQFPSISIRNTWPAERTTKIEIIAEQHLIQDFLTACKEHQIPIYGLRSRSMLEELYSQYGENK